MKLSKTISLTLLSLTLGCYLHAQDIQSLAGTWQFSLDPADQGMKENWQDRSFDKTIALPGTTDEAQYGEKTSDFSYSNQLLVPQEIYLLEQAVYIDFS